MQKLNQFSPGLKAVLFKSIIILFFTILILLLLFLLYDMANYDSSYLNKRTLTFSIDNLDSKKTKKIVEHYDNLYHKIAYKIMILFRGALRAPR